ncbi:MAG TPA: DEAD/DEAH box helicase [Pyrinomonadaceae bacterium]|nr:DEAD/DEAH box helicase [Pyrinomonadaceae bacterium]
MSLKSRFAPQLNPKIRDRGVAYFRAGAVEILDHFEGYLLARVKGTSHYFVELTLTVNSLNVACTCPYFANGEDCKHIWATMLAADSKNLLSEVDLLGPLKLIYDARALETLQQLKDDEPAPEPQSLWQQQLATITSSINNAPPRDHNPWPDNRELYYVVVPHAPMSASLNIEIAFRERNKKGEWGKIKKARIQQNQIDQLGDPSDREILSLLLGGRESYWSSYGYSGFDLPNPFTLSNTLQPLLLARMCATGRCMFRPEAKEAELKQLEWDDATTWQFWLEVKNTGNEYVLNPVLRNGSDEIEFSAAPLTTEAVVVGPDLRIARFNAKGARAWVAPLSTSGTIKIPATESRQLLAQLLALPSIPNLEVPPELHFERVSFPPQPHLIVRKPPFAYLTDLEAKLSFNYEGVEIDYFDKRDGLYDRDQNRYIERDLESENNALTLLNSLSIKRRAQYSETFRLSPRNLPRAVTSLLANGWRVEAEGKLYRTPASSSLSVSSGIDWFELHGSLNFGDDLEVKLPQLLTALRRGQKVIALGDGSFGVLPEEWLQEYGFLASFGVTEEDHLRFQRTQTGVLDALLAARPEITCDETFARVRREWQNFDGIKPVAAPRGFVGQLRDYQREGLGWFKFLQRFKFGGCLADDMGLGKTVQVLALLESRRNRESRPSLVVVPRSLIFNWQQEAARFTPKLRVLTHTGSERIKENAHFENYDLILTTYGTLRRDVIHLVEAEFDFVILDESQAIKNAATETAKAVRLLKSRYRLALSGTPIENHIGELWSLFEFLNPGMLGSSSVFQFSTNGTQKPDEESRAMLSRALRPFILRRTKQQVAKELPEKLEQTIYCEMDERQRRQYEELRDYYRRSILEKVSLQGINRSKIQILEALLRLRQTACHPALVAGSIDDATPNAKLDVLLPRLSEVTEEGHKAIVFSQFTSFLSIVRQRLDHQGVEYEYLDGKTRDREGAVERFQNDPYCKLFLISLKAGGQGLNLTAAEYVFLLDPWWNPAVEAQAIDRAHRIGQTNRVFAYRLITRDTVEEKVLELQSTKRELADAIINADNSVIRNITSEDLRLLLS